MLLDAIEAWCFVQNIDYRTMRWGMNQIQPGDDINRERLQAASVLRDLARRIGIAVSPQEVRERLEEIANQWEFWASISKKT